MNLKTYNLARKYAENLKTPYHEDLLHDAYLTWYDRKQLDLFDETVDKVITVIRFTLISTNNPTFVSLRDSDILNFTTPEDEMIASDMQSQYTKMVDLCLYKDLIAWYYNHSKSTLN